MARTIMGFATIGVAIVLMLSPNLFGIESNWPFVLGLWVGVVGLALINSRAQREDYKRKEEIKKRLKEKSQESQKDSHDEGKT